MGEDATEAAGQIWHTSTCSLQCGAMSDASYPYSSGDQNSPDYDKTESCRFDKASVVQTVMGYNSVAMPITDAELMSALVNYGPVSSVSFEWDL